MKTLVEVKGLTKSFGAVKAVNDISFEMYEGEILGLMGPNGAGKTTTLQMLLNLTYQSAGTISIFGMSYKSSREEILSRINFSSSYISLPYALTVRENLLVFARLYGVKGAGAKIDSLLKLFEIESIADTNTRKLSSGMITRVCLCKSLLNDPEILFLDEPTASLDPDIADKTRALLRRVRDERGLSVLYTSHNMDEMEELCDRIIFMHKGNVIATGKPDEILARFGGSDLEEVFLKITREPCA